MFAVGQMVFHKSSRHSGKVVDADGDTIYLLQANGVEINFPSRELTASPPDDDAAEDTGPGTRSGSPFRLPADRRGLATPVVVAPRPLTMTDVTEEHRKVLAVIPKRTLESVAVLHDRQPGAGRFSALDVAQKLNFIAKVTEIPYRTMKEHADRPGTLGLMMGRGISVRLRPQG